MKNNNVATKSAPSTSQQWDIPGHWKLLPNRALFFERAIKGSNLELSLLSVTINQGVLRQSDFLKGSSKKDSSNEDKAQYKLVQPNDLAYNKMRMWQGAVGRSDYSGLVSPAYIVLSPMRHALSNYYHYVFRLPEYSRICHQYSYGICDDQLSLRYKDFKVIYSPVPPLEEQKAIVRFLDHKCALINRYIRNKHRLIELLKEQKQAIINQAVTRGLDPNVKLKPSGVPWLGDIPEHWEIRRLKRLVQSINKQKTCKSQDEVYLALEHIESWTGRLFLPEDEILFESQVREFQPGDILFGKLRPYLAKITQPQFYGVCSGEILVLRACTNLVDPIFIEQKLRSKHVIDQINSSTFGAKMPRADWTFIGNLEFTYPPLDEQLAIVDHILQNSQKIDSAITLTENHITLLTEYRQRLIADAVTGKIDVRNIQIPDDLIDEPEVFFDDVEVEDDLELTEELYADD